MPFGDAVAAVQRFYAARDRDPLVQVQAGADLESAFVALGWSPVSGGDALFLLGSTARALRAIGPVEPTGLEDEGPRLTARLGAAVARAGLALYRPGWSNVARFPTKIGEYLASGLPVVVSSGVGDCERFVEDHGVGVCLRTFAPAENRRAARALRALLADPTVAGRCRAVAERELSVVEGVRRYAALYEGLGVVGRAASLSLPGSR